jgi:maleate cis-trans isomerase
MKTLYRIGQIVPSSNITMETEIPAILQAPIGASSCRARLKCNLVHMIWVDQAYLLFLADGADEQPSRFPVRVPVYASLASLSLT